MRSACGCEKWLWVCQQHNKHTKNWKKLWKDLPFLNVNRKKRHATGDIGDLGQHSRCSRTFSCTSFLKQARSFIHIHWMKNRYQIFPDVIAEVASSPWLKLRPSVCVCHWAACRDSSTLGHRITRNIRLCCSILLQFEESVRNHLPSSAVAAHADGHMTAERSTSWAAGREVVTLGSTWSGLRVFYIFCDWVKSQQAGLICDWYPDVFFPQQSTASAGIERLPLFSSSLHGAEVNMSPACFPSRSQAI